MKARAKGAPFGLVGAALLLAACGGGGTGANAKPPEQPFLVIQPEEARLVAAAHSVTQRVGHDVAFEVDAELMKEYAPQLNAAMSDTLETIARGIDQARAERPDITGRACISLNKLVIQSNNRFRESRASFDPKTGRLVLLVPSGVMSFTTEQQIRTAILETEPAD